MRRSTIVLLFSMLLLWAGGLRVWYASVDPHQGRFFDERFTLRNLKRTATHETLLDPANAYYPGLSWIPIAFVYRASEALATATGEEWLRTFRDGVATPHAYRLGRFVSTLYGLLALWMLYLIGRRLFDPRVGLLSAFLLAATYLHLRLSGILKPETLLLLTTLLAVWLALRAGERPSWVRFLAAGGGVGLALSAKYNGGPAAFCLIALTIMLVWEGRWRAVGWLAAAGGAAVAVFLLLNPWAVTTPELLVEAFHVHADQYRVKGEMRTGGESWRQLPFLVQLVTNRFGHGPVVGAVGLAALPLLGWQAFRVGLRTPRGRGVVMVLAFVLGYGILYTVSSGGNLKLTNWLPLLPWTALGAAWLSLLAWRALRSHVPILRTATASVVVVGLVALGIAWPATAVPYRVLLSGTPRVASIAIGNRLSPTRGRTVVSEASREEAVLRRGGDYLALRTVRELGAASRVLDAADAELFPAFRLKGPDERFYLRRIERVRPEYALEVGPRLFHVHGPKLIAIVHDWNARGKLGLGAFKPDPERVDGWSATLPVAYRDRIVSLDLRLPRVGSGELRATLQLGGDEVSCVRLTRKMRGWRFFRCPRIHAPREGRVRLRTVGLPAGARRVDYSVQAWSRPRALRAGVPALPQASP